MDVDVGRGVRILILAVMGWSVGQAIIPDDLMVPGLILGVCAGGAYVAWEYNLFEKIQKDEETNYQPARTRNNER
jgi:hypothetical protein